MLRSCKYSRLILTGRLSEAMETLRQRKKFTKQPATKAEGLIQANIPKTADEKFAAEAGLRTRGHGLSGTVVASAGVLLEDVPPRSFKSAAELPHLDTDHPVSPVRRSTRAKKVPSNLYETALEKEASSMETPADGAPTAEKPKRKRAAKTPDETWPTKKAAALTAGAPSLEVHVWDSGKMAAAVAHLRTCDAGVAALAEEFGPAEALFAKGNVNMFSSLTRSIAGQQLAIAAAATIYLRFLTVCKRGLEDPVQPKDVLAAKFGDLRGCGLSGMKANYLTDLARHFDDGLLSDDAIFGMDDMTLITELTKVKGIGRWSVDMFSMFHLGRPDVLPVGDLGVRNGMKHLYNLKEVPTPEQMESLTESWRPYRSLGSYYMWKAIDKKTAAEKAAKAVGKEKVKAAKASTVPM